MIISICSIIKNEHQYLEEWINYHLNLGFNKIYLYEDVGSDSHFTITNKYEQVILQPITNITENNCLKQNHMNENFVFETDSDWVAFIDVDEFITIDPNLTLEDILQEYSNTTGLYLFWKTYGANGHVHKPSGGVLKNFINEAFIKESHVNFSFKSFVHIKPYIKEVSKPLNKKQCTNPNLVPKRWWSNHEARGLCTTDGVQWETNVRKRIEPIHQKIWINHFFTKSWDEWVWKIKTRGDLVPNNRKILDFFKYNPNMLKLKEELMNSL